jgi:hypothetical protein
MINYGRNYPGAVMRPSRRQSHIWGSSCTLPRGRTKNILEYFISGIGLLVAVPNGITFFLSLFPVFFLSPFSCPEYDRISTSHIERFNLSLRMGLRRFTQLTNAHSKSHKHHVAMQCIFVAWYDFARKHETLKGRTSAMASGLTDRVWTIRELLENAAAY